MSAPASGGGLRSLTVEQFLRLYGPTLALIVAVVVLVAALPTEDSGSDVSAGSSGALAGPAAVDASVGGSGPDAATAVSGTTGGTANGSAAGPQGGSTTGGSTTGGSGTGEPGGDGTAKGTGTAQAAVPPTGPTTADGKVAIVKSGADCRGDGRLIGVSVWQPPCVVWQPGSDNGGATSRGVSNDKVLVTFNLAELNTAAFAVGTAAGIQQSKEQIKTYSELWRKYYNNHTQTYGREVVFKYVDASGSDDAALRADVRRAATEDKSFAFLGACCTRGQLQEGGAQKLVMVTSPGQPIADDLAQNPYTLSRQPTTDAVFEDAGIYICRRLAGHKAKWAGDAGLKQAKRKFGLLYSSQLSQSGGSQSPVVPVLERQLAKCGESFAVKVGISSDTSSWSNEASNAIAKMKSAGVTTIVYFAPILSQVFMTQAADRQVYNPEWYVGGTCCNDAVIVNRAASRSQVQHFFGTSNQFFWWRDDASKFEAVREAVVGNGGQPLPDVGSSGSATNNAALTGTIWWPLIQGFFGCLQLAGPTLTPETWRRGCDRYGSAGGYIQNFAFPTRFFTAQRPFMIQDQNEWWWDPNATCNDEANRSGRGCTKWVANGRRTGLNGWPSGEPDMFNPGNADIAPNPPIVWTQTRPVNKRCMSCA